MCESVTKRLFTNNVDQFSQLGLHGDRWLLFRDIPELIQKFGSGTKTLDYGCGPGFSTRFLQKLGLEVDGVDVDNSMIELAKAADCAAKYSVIVDGRIPEDDERYDLVFASLVLNYISTKEEIAVATREIARVLKKDGVFIGIVPSENTSKYEWLNLCIDFDENRDLYSGCHVKGQWKDSNIFFYAYYWTAKDYRGVFETGGLQTLEIHCPLGKDSDGYAWINEREKNICDIYITKRAK